MEKLLFPCFLVMQYSEHLKRHITAPLVVPNGVLPMDLYNALLSAPFTTPLDIYYSWLTNRGRIFSQEEAAEFALQNDLLDKRIPRLTIEHYKGVWRL